MIDESLIEYLTDNPDAVDDLDEETIDKLIAYLIIEIKRKEKLLEEIKNQQ